MWPETRAGPKASYRLDFMFPWRSAMHENGIYIASRDKSFIFGESYGHFHSRPHEPFPQHPS
jgi:hypothetical protein